MLGSKTLLGSLYPEAGRQFKKPVIGNSDFANLLSVSNYIKGVIYKFLKKKKKTFERIVNCTIKRNRNSET